VHGVANSIHQVLYHPGLMLALLGIIIVGTVFHELGHASALRYGGEKSAVSGSDRISCIRRFTPT
jgi:putative peptide zinc metalloprotease protein